VVRIRLALSPEGLLRGFEAEGHAGGAARGSNIACAAATALLRTAAGLCAEHGIVRSGGAAAPGQLRCELAAPGPAARGWLAGVSDFLIKGVSDLRDEFPGEIAVQVERTED
jgi:uncharacterized protein YsxB (DUF464 family)